MMIMMLVIGIIVIKLLDHIEGVKGNPPNLRVSRTPRVCFVAQSLYEWEFPKIRGPKKDPNIPRSLF